MRSFPVVKSNFLTLLYPNQAPFARGLTLFALGDTIRMVIFARWRECMKNACKMVLFDLDGTLLDTLDDLTDSVNTVLRRYGCP